GFPASSAGLRSWGDPFQCSSKPLVQRHWPAAFTVDIYMHEKTLGGCLRFVVAEEPDLVANRRRAKSCNLQAGGNNIGEGDFGEIAAAGLDHQSDLAAAMDIERPLLDEPAIHGRVEERIMHHIVHVAVDVIVHPARGDGAEGAIVAARGGC